MSASSPEMLPASDYSYLTTFVPAAAFAHAADEIGRDFKAANPLHMHDRLKHGIVAILPYNAETHHLVANTQKQGLYAGMNIIVYRMNGEKCPMKTAHSIADISRALNLAYLEKDNVAITRGVNLEAAQVLQEGADEHFVPKMPSSLDGPRAVWSRHIKKVHLERAAKVGSGAALVAPWASRYDASYALNNLTRVELGNVFMLKTSPDEMRDLGCKLGSMKHGARSPSPVKAPFPQAAVAVIP